MRVRERERDRQRGRERQRQRGRETDRQTNRQRASVREQMLWGGVKERGPLGRREGARAVGECEFRAILGSGAYLCSMY